MRKGLQYSLENLNFARNKLNLKHFIKFMQDIWKKFVFPLIEAKKRNSEEESYHALIENQLQLLGWASYMGEICHKENIPIGNNNYIQPDILVKENNEVQFVIEVKRPVHELSERERVQLESYMRQLKIEVGIYIGDHIEVIYDKPKSKNAITVLTVTLDLEDKRGGIFVDQFSKENFNRDKIIKFCEDRIIQIKKQADLNKVKKNIISDANNLIADSLAMSLIEKYGDTFSKEEIKGMLSTLSFKAIDLKPASKISKKDKDVPKIVKCHISRNCDAFGHFNIQEQSLTVLKGSKINPITLSSLKAHDIQRRQRLIKDNAQIINGEAIVSKDVSFKSPSGAALFCIGGSSNGWLDWQDENGNRLDSYRTKK